MKFPSRTFIALILVSSHLYAAPAEDLAGVYKKRFKSGIIAAGKSPGEADTPYQAEDIVEIVKEDENTIYFRIHLDFYNGHSCGLYGLAKWDGNKYLFRDKEKKGTELCFLTIGTKGTDLFITDRKDSKSEATCSAYCGVRGTLSNYSIPLSLRRPIKYLKRIKDSVQYQTATH